VQLGRTLARRCTARRLRNVVAKLPEKREIGERVKRAYWAALDEAGRKRRPLSRR